ncbi:hypothetical protein [Mucisphaera calidilacus]|uniref:PEP-CTERM protein-sorting domain-containing protein n=1 Tax=Mucisphaera calidilacus TaxID=2527982 RepID=A0A518BY33_9BACT|nr:hypothetical protein [Mucisphaera calidilacus]QDU71868.1 hypothetical protein Pan265_17250 [Mucisphaera calidilacus]
MLQMRMGMSCVALTLCAGAQAATVTQYAKDEAGWLAAVGSAGLSVEVETFDSANPGDDVSTFSSPVIDSYQSNFSGLSFVDTGLGDIAVQDRVSTFMDLSIYFAGGEGSRQTLITFKEDVFGFGADVQSVAGSAGLGVAILMDVNGIVSIISPEATEEFWGIISDMSFDRILLIAGYNPNPLAAPRSDFYIDDIAVATDSGQGPVVPTPESFAAGLALLGLSALRRRRTN